MIFETIQRDGQMASLESVGASVLANACGPCIGQWKRDDVAKGTKNSIVTSFNRNFPGRNDSNPETLAFIASPEITLALGLAGSLSFNPMKDSLVVGGKSFRLSPPPEAPEVPAKGFQAALGGYQAPAADGSKVEVKVKPESGRLALLDPFPKPEAAQYLRMPLLLKTQGKTTTDHISPAGPWLRFRGHLDKISDNMFTGAIRAVTGERGTTRNPLTGEQGQAVPAVARALKAAGRKWIVVGDENYGEGSSREHAAMSPRHLGAAVVLVRSFARIHESNLKKQGILPLTFASASDWEKVREDDEFSLPDALGIAPGKDVTLVLHHKDGTDEKIEAKHSCNAEQIGWIRAGGALNLLRQ
jgi:aconitate hydratase